MLWLPPVFIRGRCDIKRGGIKTYETHQMIQYQTMTQRAQLARKASKNPNNPWLQPWQHNETMTNPPIEYILEVIIDKKQQSHSAKEYYMVCLKNKNHSPQKPRRMSNEKLGAELSQMAGFMLKGLH